MCKGVITNSALVVMFALLYQKGLQQNFYIKHFFSKNIYEWATRTNGTGADEAKHNKDCAKSARIVIAVV